MKIRISANDAFGDAVARKISELTREIREKADEAVRTVAKASLEKIKEQAAAKLYRTKDQYILGLKYSKIGSGIYSITLDASAAHLELGYDSYDMKKGLLYLGRDIPDHAKGKIKVSKAGYRYRAIPFDHNMSAAKPNHPLHNTIQGTYGPSMSDRLQGTTTGQTTRGIRDAFKASGMGGVTKDPRTGIPIIGPIGTVKPHPENKNQIIFKSPNGEERTHTVGRELHSNVMGARKYQYEVKNRNGGTTVKSAYMTFRIVSEDPKHAHKWIHPGFKGVRIFPDVQKWAESTLDRMITEIISEYK
jgi:hypothetical protein